MPLPIWAIPAAIQAGTALAKYATRKKTPSFEGTKYGKYLRRIGEEGRFSPGERSTMLGQVSSRAGNVAQQERAGIRGYLENRGMGRSIAGTRALNEPGLERMRTVSGATERIELENERSKEAALEEYERARYGSQMQMAGEERQAKSELWGGLAGAAGFGAETALAAYRTRVGYGGDKPDAIDLSDMSESQLMEWIQKQRDPQQAFEMLLMMGYLQ